MNRMDPTLPLPNVETVTASSRGPLETRWWARDCAFQTRTERQPFESVCLALPQSVAECMALPQTVAECMALPQTDAELWPFLSVCLIGRPPPDMFSRSACTDHDHVHRHTPQSHILA